MIAIAPDFVYLNKSVKSCYDIRPGKEQVHAAELPVLMCHRCWLLLVRPCGWWTTTVPRTSHCPLAAVGWPQWRCRPMALSWQCLAWTASSGSCQVVSFPETCWCRGLAQNPGLGAFAGALAWLGSQHSASATETGAKSGWSTMSRELALLCANLSMTS